MRYTQLHNWLASVLESKNYKLQPLAGDASFRHYYRLTYNNQTYIVMDAPVEQENCQPFITIATALAQAGLQVPHIDHKNLVQGFLILSDFGSRHYLDMLNNNNVEVLYNQACLDLLKLQTCSTKLPAFDIDFLQKEFNLFNSWFLNTLLNVNLHKAQIEMLEMLFNNIAKNVLSQPTVFVHRDYHSRNLMYCDNHSIGILDFQDAVFGPITYDVVSLFKDCYICWPKDRVKAWVFNFRDLLIKHNRLDTKISKEQFLYWFDWMGLQRHLKVLGIFARLALRDGKRNYLQELPRVMHYVLEMTQLYHELSDFHGFMLQQNHAVTNILGKQE